MRRILYTFVPCALAAALAVPSSASDAAKPAANPAKPAVDAAKPAAKPAVDPMMEAWMKAATPGAQHKLLGQLEGTWTVASDWYMDPTKPAEHTTGKSSKKMVFGGRFLQEEFSGTAMGQPFHGMGVSGYDNIAKKYVNTWFDSMGTMIMISHGDADPAGKVVNWKSEFTDPMTGKPSWARMVLTINSADRHNFLMFGPGPDGKEYKMMEINYEREKMAGAMK